MPVTLEQVIEQLGKEEPDYEFAARLGTDALPHLLRLVQETDRQNPGYAAKAACLASFIDADESAAILRIAARSPDPALRASAAASLANLKRFLPDVASSLIKDEDAGIRKWVLNALSIHIPSGFKADVEEMSRTDPDVKIRQLAKQVTDRIKN